MPVVVDCRCRRTNRAVLRDILEDGLGLRGLKQGMVVARLLEALKRAFTRQSVHPGIVLDKAEVLFQKEGPGLVYDFLEVNKEIGQDKGSLSVLIVSRFEVWEFMNLATVSLFGRRNIIRNLKPSASQRTSWSRTKTGWRF